MGRVMVDVRDRRTDSEGAEALASPSTIDRSCGTALECAIDAHPGPGAPDPSCDPHLGKPDEHLALEVLGVEALPLLGLVAGVGRVGDGDQVHVGRRDAGDTEDLPNRLLGPTPIDLLAVHAFFVNRRYEAAVNDQGGSGVVLGRDSENDHQ